MFFQLLLLLCLGSTPPSAKTDDWVYVGDSVDKSSFFMRSSSVSNSYTKKVWVKRQGHTFTSKKNGKIITYRGGHQVLLYEFECNERKLKVLGSTSYSAQGKTVETYNYPEYTVEWTYASPESVGDMLVSSACELF